MNTNMTEAITFSKALRLVPATAIERAHNVLPAGATMKGDMTAHGGLAIRIDGEYTGSITMGEGSSVYIAKDAVVDAVSIEADTILVEGRIKGNVTARKAIELASTALIQGTLNYHGELDVHAGAKVRGQINGPQD